MVVARSFGRLVMVNTGPLDDFAGGDMRFDGIEKANELLMAMALHVAADDRPVEYIRAANNVVVPWRL